MKFSRRDFGRLLGAGTAAAGMAILGDTPKVLAQPVAGLDRPLQGSDRDEVLTLIYRYSYTYDSKDLDAFVSLFTDDAVWETYNPGSSTPSVLLDGVDAIRSFVEARMENLRQNGIQSRHYQTNSILTTSGANSAHGVTMIMLMWQLRSEPIPQPKTTGFYSDQFVKTQGGWKFARRSAYVDQAGS